MKSALITGISGQDGSYLAEYLLELGYQVWGMVRRDPASTRWLQPILSRIEIVYGDLRDAESLAVAFQKAWPDEVYNLAGQVFVPTSWEVPAETFDINVGGLLRLLQIVERTKRDARVYQASSSEMVGNWDGLCDAQTPLRPTSPYGVSKLAAEQYCRAFHRVYGTDVVSLRYFSVYGPRGRPDQVIHKFTKSLLEGRPPVIQGDGSHTRDFTYVTDIVAANILAAQNDGLGGEVFNIGFGSRTSVSGLAERLTKILSPGRMIPPTHVEEGPGEFPDTQASNRKAAELLRWRPGVDLDEGLRMFVDWFKTTTEVVGEAR